MKTRQNPAPGAKARDILAKNLRRLMGEHPSFDSQRKLGAKAKVADGSIGYMLDPATGNPTLDNIAKVAAVFGLDPWQLLHPDMAVRAMTAKEIEMYEAIRAAVEGKPKR